MASEEDNFDIDIYADGDAEGDYKPDITQTDGPADSTFKDSTTIATNGEGPYGSTATPTPQTYPSDGLSQQGVKRKESSDERPIEAGATTALMISDLHWWSTEDDIRGWANQASCEDELKDVTFSEHKVNGKSKGQAYVEFVSLQAASAVKVYIDSLMDNQSGQPGSRKHTVTFAGAHVNPFKTYPKDGQGRAKEERSSRTSSGSFNTSQNSYNNNSTGNYRGRGGFNREGGMNNSFGGSAGYNSYYRNFSNPSPTYSSNPGGYQNGMMNTTNFGGFNRGGGGMMNQHRGGIGGMRGGRGGMGMNNNINNNLTMGMGMNGMGMAMNPMLSGMGMQAPGSFAGGAAPFNPAFFNQPSGGDGSWNNPHGAKRTRQE